jgi:hypothetical protein
MTAIQRLSESYDYDPHAYDKQRHNAHHLALIQAMEPAPGTGRDKYVPVGWPDDDVITIRELYAAGQYTHKRLADLFGCTSTTIANIVNGRTYEDVGGPISHHRDHMWKSA